MLSSLYRMVNSILSREGTTATLQQLGATGTYNPATGEYSPAATVSTTVRVALLDFAYETSGRTPYKETIIEKGDKDCWMDAKINGVDLTTKPSPTGDTLVVNGVTWRIMAMKEYNVNDSYTIAYQLLLRKG